MIKRLIKLAIHKYKHKNCKIKLTASISSKSVIDDNVEICNNVIVFKSSIGRYTYIESNSKIECANIGKYCSIAQNVKCGLGIHPVNEFVSTHPLFYRKEYGFVEEQCLSEYKDTIIGNDVWIGENAIILGGINIGNGAIIGAGAVVTKNIPDYAVAVGIPAKVIKFRFNKDQINKLNELKWWDKDECWLKANCKTMRNIDNLDKIL